MNPSPLRMIYNVFPCWLISQILLLFAETRFTQECGAIENCNYRLPLGRAVVNRYSRHVKNNYAPRTRHLNYLTTRAFGFSSIQFSVLLVSIKTQIRVYHAKWLYVCVHTTSTYCIVNIVERQYNITSKRVFDVPI